jgi:AraC-like DNA-binding protein
MTPHQYYLDRKIRVAAALLRSGLSVKETAYRLSVDSPYYFSRLFKKKTGGSPLEYKQSQGSAASGGGRAFPRGGLVVN